MDDKKELTRFITIRVSEEDFKKYKAYLQYIAKTNVQEDIRGHVKERGKLVDDATLKLAESHLAKRKSKG